MVALSLFAVAASLAGFAAADLSITIPATNEWWIAQSANNLAWTCQESSFDNFTVLITNNNPGSVLPPEAIIAIQENFDCSVLITPQQLTQPAAQGYQILFSNPFNETDVYAQSSVFEIKPVGSAYPATTSVELGTSATATGSAAAASTSGKKNGATSLKTLSLGISVGLAAGIAYLM